MNVLSVIHYPDFGGPHNQALTLCDPLRTNGYETIVLLPDEPGNAFDRLRKQKIEVIKTRLHRARSSWDPKVHMFFIAGFFSEILAIRRIIRDRKIDIILIGGLVNPHAAIAGTLENRPVVWQILDTRTPKLLRLILFPLIKFFSDAVMCTGKKVADEHPGINSLKDSVYYYVPPVDHNKFKPDDQKRQLARAALEIDDHSLCIGSVGNITPQKGYETLLTATATVKKIHDNIRVRILGKNMMSHEKYNRYLDNIARSAGWDNPIQFQMLDPEDKVSELLPGFDIFIMSSVPSSEGIPTAIIEAMACAVPVIATDVGAINEVIQHGKTGYVVSPKNPGAIAELMIKLIDDKKLRRALGAAARQSVVDKYGLEHCTRSHVMSFTSAFNRHHATR
jgi:glycosyltransferase involved in cell wall biosynthesis